MWNITPSQPKNVGKTNFKRCIYCASYESRDCVRDKCLYGDSIRKKEAKSYRTLVDQYFAEKKNSHLRKKASLTAHQFHGRWFLTVQHEKRFAQALKLLPEEANREHGHQVATLYLLTAENPLWQMVKGNAKYPSYIGELKDIEGATTQQYALFQVAKYVAQGKKYPNMTELARGSLVSAPIFMVIINGLLIAEHGKQLLEGGALTVNFESGGDVN